MVGGAVAEDFDGDGWVDLFVLRGGEAPSLLYINQMDGTFAEEAQARGADLAYESWEPPLPPPITTTTGT